LADKKEISIRTMDEPEETQEEEPKPDPVMSDFYKRDE
jgi:hypothetical protein